VPKVSRSWSRGAVAAVLAAAIAMASPIHAAVADDTTDPSTTTTTGPTTSDPSDTTTSDPSDTTTPAELSTASTPAELSAASTPDTLQPEGLPKIDPPPPCAVDCCTTPDVQGASAPIGASTPSGGTACAPTAQFQQTADLDSHGDAVANSGTNTGSISVAGSPAGAPVGGTLTATVDTGAGSAAGGSPSTAIAQTAAAFVQDNAKITIYQLALVLNVGIALAQSGSNVALAGSGAGTGATEIDTGDANATGLSGSTAVTQVVHLLDESRTSTQTASVVNVGVGTANTGGNLAILNTAPGGSSTALAVAWGPRASVTTGSADAAGNATKTSIIQVAIGTATEDGVICITQRAIVVNFGAGFANSGANGAFAGTSQGLLIDSVITAIVTALLEAKGLGLPGVTDAGSGTGTALIGTGNASAVGNTHSTSVLQRAFGSVSGDHFAVATQDAAVANFGIATANTGLNAAGDVAESESVSAAVSSIVDAITALALGPVDTDTSWSAAESLGALFLQTYAELAVLESSMSDGAHDSAGGNVKIRQIVGVLNLMFALAVTGSNQAGTNSLPPEQTVRLLEAVHEGVGELNSVMITTGDATAVGSDSHVVVCQVIEVDPSVCKPPAVPVVRPVVPLLAPVPIPKVPVTRLAFTGGGGTEPLAIGGTSLLLLGLVLVLVARRSRLVGR